MYANGCDASAVFALGNSVRVVAVSLADSTCFPPPAAGPEVIDSDHVWWHPEYSTPEGCALEPPPGTPLEVTVDCGRLQSEFAQRHGFASFPYLFACLSLHM